MPGESLKPGPIAASVLLILLGVASIGGIAGRQSPPANIEFVPIPRGEFMMGCSAGDDECDPNERPAHLVRITKAFELGKFEVTQAQWESVMERNPSGFKGADHPVEQVTWNDVHVFLQKLNARQDGYAYRLPSEAEWEYAARAGTKASYAGPLGLMAWYGNNSGRTVLDADALWHSDESSYGRRLSANGNQTHPVGKKQPNAWGLFDMHGNVWEWVEDWYGRNYYESSPQSDPEGPGAGQQRVLRGGCWYDGAWNTRVSSRLSLEPSGRSVDIGFRCVRERKQ